MLLQRRKTEKIAATFCMHLVSENRACTGGTESNFLNEASIKALATLIASADNLCCNPGLQIRIQLFTSMRIRI
jgi:hypothetical protein